MRLLIIISILFLSCKKVSKEKINIHKKPREVFSHNLNKKIILPENFYKISLDSFSKKIIDLNENEEIKKVLMNSFGKIKAIPNTEVFIEKENVKNCFWFQKGPRIELDNKIAEQYIWMLDNEFVKTQKIKGYEVNKVESKFFHTANSSIIKVKYLVKIDIEKKYQTQFLVSIYGKPFTLFVFNNSDKNRDIEPFIKTL